MMSNPDNSERGSSPLDRRIQHVLWVIAISIGGWTVVSIDDARQNISKMTVELPLLKEQLKEMKESMRDRYTRTDATGEHLVINRGLDDHEKRIRKLEALK